MCPVLSLTPWVEDVVGWFESTYDIEVGMGFARWRRIALPYAGGLAAQPAKLMAAVQYVADLRNGLLARDMRAKRKRPTPTDD